MIEKFGEVLVTLEEITVSDFHFDNTKDGKIASVEAMEWAIKELKKSIKNVNDKFN